MPHRELEDLADAVRRHGLRAVLLAPPGRPHRVRVTTGEPGVAVSEEIELTDDGLRWAWGQRLAGSTASEQASAVEAYFASVPA